MMIKDIKYVFLSFSLWLLGINSLFSQVLLEADGKGDAYGLIESKGYGVEVPDCVHSVKHITEVWDSVLQKNVFVFTLHRDADNDRCINFDRQRCEIKTWGHSPKNMVATPGETYIYHWKFKLDAGFQPSPAFCHIHQIKASTGPDAGSPLITLTPRAGNPEKLQLIYNPPAGVKGSGVMKDALLKPFKGQWVEVEETIQYGHHGTYHIVIKRFGSDDILLAWSNDDLDMWRDGTDICRPKFGIYRSLKSKSFLRDESICFADFSITEMSQP